MPQPLGITPDERPIPVDPVSKINALYPPPSLTDFGEPIIPADYYITTGEICQKTAYLVKVIESHATRLLMYPPTPEANRYGAAVNIALKQARSFLAEMIALKGPWLWFETDSIDGVLVVRRKTSRTIPRPNVKKPKIASESSSTHRTTDESQPVRRRRQKEDGSTAGL